MAAMATSRPSKTVDDYLALGDGVRAELIAGELYVTPSPTPDHQTIVGNLHVLLRSAVRSGAGGSVYVAPLDVHLPSGDIVQPDLLWIAASNHSIVQDWIRGVPDLLVEIVSPLGAERDRIVKRALYARNGVPEYWIVDGATQTVERLVLARPVLERPVLARPVLEGTGNAPAGYTPAGYYGASDTLVTERLADIPIPLQEVFAPA